MPVEAEVFRILIINTCDSIIRIATIGSCFVGIPHMYSKVRFEAILLWDILRVSNGFGSSIVPSWTTAAEIL